VDNVVIVGQPVQLVFRPEQVVALDVTTDKPRAVEGVIVPDVAAAIGIYDTPADRQIGEYNQQLGQVVTRFFNRMSFGDANND
jgi:hypothetical protein